MAFLGLENNLELFWKALLEDSNSKHKIFAH